MKQPAKKCGTCRFGGDHFRLFDGTNLHCEHPDEKVAGEPGWDTLRHWYDSCAEWAAKEQLEPTRRERREGTIGGKE